ncbi:CHAD domain-containing protein [Chitinophaga agrisoli]|nr:CHAD domain-containing protein [Chitinophaga agrisoli]
MMWETLHAYLQDQCATIMDLAPVIGEKSHKKDVHKLRVTIKKTRACLDLARQLSNKAFKGKKYIRLLKVLQQAAGALRDLQLQEESLLQYTGNGRRYAPFHLLQKNHAQLAAQQARAIADAFPLAFVKTLPKQLQKKDVKATGAKDAGAYLQQQYAAISLPLGRGPAEKWHDLRKEVKRLHYQLSILQPLFDTSKGLEEMLRFTDEAGSCLGAWHDLLALQQVIRQHMRLLRSEGMTVPAGTDELLKRIAADTRQELQRCKAWIQQKPDVTI